MFHKNNELPGLSHFPPKLSLARIPGVICRLFLCARSVAGVAEAGRADRTIQQNETHQHMDKMDYHATITVKAPAHDVFKSITTMSAWWTEDFEGRSTALNDVFTIGFGPRSFVTCKLVELVPDRKAVWHVTDCNLDRLKDKKEWRDTRLIFRLAPEDGNTRITFTHVGIVPGIECYKECVKGWDQYIKGSLPKLIMEGVGLPAKKK